MFGVVFTVLLVILLNNKRELTLFDNFMIVFVPSADGGVSWTRKLCEGVKVESIHNEPN